MNRWIKISLKCCFLFVPCSYFLFFSFSIQQIKPAAFWSSHLSDLQSIPVSLLDLTFLAFLQLWLKVNLDKSDHKCNQFWCFLSASLAADLAEHCEGLSVSAHCCSVIRWSLNLHNEHHPDWNNTYCVFTCMSADMHCSRRMEVESVGITQKKQITTAVQ